MSGSGGVPDFDVARMGDREEWLFRPVLAQVLRAESLIDGTVDLEYVATLNEALDVQAENQRRLRAALKTQE